MEMEKTGKSRNVFGSSILSVYSLLVCVSEASERERGAWKDAEI